MQTFATIQGCFAGFLTSYSNVDDTTLLNYQFDPAFFVSPGFLRAGSDLTPDPVSALSVSAAASRPTHQ